MARKRTPNIRLSTTSHPVIYEVNARVFLRELSASEGRKITLGTIPDDVLDEWADLGFDAIWMMGIWTTGEIALEMARTFEPLRDDYRKVLPDLKEEDISASPYAVQEYTVVRGLGGGQGLAKLRERLATRGVGLILDFVCNHTARDHEWVRRHPEYYINGAEGDAEAHPEFYFNVKTSKGMRVLAFGRDPTFPGWTDTAQLNYTNPATRAAVIGQLNEVASLCDGVRCDMAMLLLQDVFRRTWRDRATPPNGKPAEGEFWKQAIDTVRAEHPGFIFLAEAYWNLEWNLQQLGFSYTYDKVLYDRLLREGAGAVRDHLRADMEFQRHCLRFIENHDEPRAAALLPAESWLFAAATVAATVPGMVLIHDGQLEGRKVRVPVQLTRRPAESPAPEVRSFYRRLLSCLVHPVFDHGEWQLLNARPAWHDNVTSQNFLAFWWHHADEGSRLVIMNYAPHSGQCYIDLPLELVKGSPLEFRDLLSRAVFVRDRTGLQAKGMYFDLPGYGCHIFEVGPPRK